MRAKAWLSLAVVSCSIAPAQAIPISIVNNLPGTFVDISTTGTQVTPPSDGSVVDSTGGIGNALFPAGPLIIAENGGVAVGTPASNSLSPTNDPIPSTNAFGGSQAILGYWDDLIQPNIATCPGKMGGIFRAVSPGDSVIIEYQNVCGHGANRAGGSPDVLTFEIKIFDSPIPSPGIYAQILYADIQRSTPNGGAGATIGYQDGGLGNNDFQWSFNTANSVMDGTVLSIVPEPATLFSLATLGLTRRRHCTRTERCR